VFTGEFEILMKRFPFLVQTTFSHIRKTEETLRRLQAAAKNRF
jgi:hypothetical protein